MRYKIALVQAKFSNRDIEANLDQMKTIVQQSKAHDPDLKLIVFPELAATGYFLSTAIRAYAQGLDGWIAERMAELARDNELYIGYGYVELGSNGSIYNSLAFFNRQGERVSNYRKIHLTGLERDVFTPGDEIVSVQTELGHIGLMICWDLAFPEMARTLAVRGVELILSPSAWEQPYDDPLVQFSKARALDNTVYVGVCNHIDRSEDLVMCGRSGLYGPDGVIVACAEADLEKVIVAEIDLEHRRRQQSGFYSMLKERRIDLYGLKGELETGVQS